MNIASHLPPSHKTITALAVAVFLLCLATGTFLSSQKPLWTDELHTQIGTIDRADYSAILTGRFPEGNLCPLFYIVQETMSRAFHYQFPFVWKGEYGLWEPRSQILLRIPANIYMSLAVALLFWFFARFYSLTAGCVALAAALSSTMVWSYWAEARPYSLWFLLTTLQFLFLLYTIRYPDKPANAWITMGAVHVLLSLSITFSVFQIVLVSWAFWMNREKDWKRYLWITALPVGLCYFYYALSKNVYPWVPSDDKDSLSLIFKTVNFTAGDFVRYWTEFISVHIPGLWLLLFLLCAGFLLIKRFLKIPSPQPASTEKELTTFLVLMPLLLLCALIILKIFNAWKTSSTYNLAVCDRFFIFLVPAGIITFVLCFVYLVKIFQNDRWMRLNISVGITAILLITGLQTWLYMISLGLY